MVERTPQIVISSTRYEHPDHNQVWTVLTCETCGKRLAQQLDARKVRDLQGHLDGHPLRSDRR